MTTKIKPKKKICKICNKEFYGRDNRMYCSKNCKNKSRKENNRLWNIKTKRWLKDYEKHSDKIKEYKKDWRQTNKGKLNTLNCNERRRKKILLLTGRYLEKLDSKFLIDIRSRDKICVYCGNKFNNNIHSRKETIDHFNCDEPLSKDNAVRCCWSCNSSKRNVPLEKIPEWIKRKKINPSPIVMELLNKKLKTISARSFN